MEYTFGHIQDGIIPFWLTIWQVESDFGCSCCQIHSHENAKNVKIVTYIFPEAQIVGLTQVSNDTKKVSEVSFHKSTCCFCASSLTENSLPH